MIGKIIKFYRKIFWSLEKQARYSGVSMGINNFIASAFWSSEAYLIKIGDNCQITNGVKFFTHGGGGAARAKYPRFDCFGKITVGNYVYFGNGSMVMPGVEIGDNVLVAAGSVVTKSVPSNVVVGGNPAVVLCTIDTYIQKNMKYNLDSKGLSSNEKKEMLLTLPDEQFIKKPLMKNM